MEAGALANNYLKRNQCVFLLNRCR